MANQLWGTDRALPTVRVGDYSEGYGTAQVDPKDSSRNFIGLRPHVFNGIARNSASDLNVYLHEKQHLGQFPFPADDGTPAWRGREADAQGWANATQAEIEDQMGVFGDQRWINSGEDYYGGYAPEELPRYLVETATNKYRKMLRDRNLRLMGHK